ncbi:hypothetical protein [Oscillibacter sp.]|uniref:hypothetical protein n=1 Tax=Oscillibacter sp. TaxID=1945593 RepID=UPI002590B6D3|nr:hypothetical protein [Oscillibacter sp.]
MADMKYTAKDSVFSFIFRQPENTRRLYLTLHPEDVDVTEADCKLVTLEHILTNGMTNDLGFQVRDKLILLVEAQSKFSINIALRMLLYLAATYKEYVEEQKLDLYGSKPVSIPRPELYMVYTGAPRQLPEILRLSDMYDGPGGAEIEITVLKDTGAGNIVDQYIRFCEISDEQRKQYGYTMKAVEETLRICCEENILMPFLASRQKEVQDIMVTLFNQERVTEIHEYNLVKDAKREGRIETAKSLMDALNLSVEQVLTALKIPKEEHETYRKLLENH